MTEFRFPKVGQRVSVSGKTGSGKTQFGVWLFGAMSDFRSRPHVMIDYKGDSLIANIERANEIGLNEVPKNPGLYVLRPRIDQQEAVENYLWKIWERENIGLFFDEGYMIPNQGALNAILTQGRSKRISSITLTQRPVNCSRFVFSEAEYFALFHLNEKRDHDTVRGFLPMNSVFDMTTRLPNYTARWYDVAQDYSAYIKPVPPEDNLLDLYDEKLKPRLKRL